MRDIPHWWKKIPGLTSNHIGPKKYCQSCGQLQTSLSTEFCERPSFFMYPDTDLEWDPKSLVAEAWPE